MTPGMRAMAWTLGMLLGGAMADRALGQGSPPEGLQPGEVLVRLSFHIFVDSTPTPPNLEGKVTTEKGSFRVVQHIAAKYRAPAPGKRTLSQFRILGSDSDQAYLIETRTYVRSSRYGEGGLFPDPVSRSEEWKADGVPLSLPQFDIEIDLDAKTWIVREFADDPNGWFGELTKAQSYTGREYDYDTRDGKKKWKPVDFPGIPFLNKTALDLASPGFAKLGDSQVLDSTDGSLSGGGHLNPLETKDLKGNWRFRWAVLDSSPALELRVTAKGYEDWNPTVKNYDPARQVIDPGKPLSLTAKVIDPTGKIPVVRIRELRWTLHETSQLPGIALNYPYQSTETSPDLSLAKRLPTQDKKQEIVEENLTTLKSSINVYPWDWGGWSTLRVEATLDDGMKLQGKLKGPDGDETDIRLPDRAADSKIHRKWMEDHAVKHRGDDDWDEDGFPLGKESALGDGFSKFEEYRGFYVTAKVGHGESKMEHVSTEPHFRNVFFYDQMKNDDSRAAMRLFVTASVARAYVLHQEDGVIDGSRVVNANRGAGPTQGAQHAIRIPKPVTSNAAWRPMASGTRPRNAGLFVSDFSSFQLHAPKLSGQRDLYRRSIAQALLESCGVPRPGSGDRDYTLTVSRGADGGPQVVAEPGGVVTLRDESGHDIGDDWLRRVENAASASRRLKHAGGNAAAMTLESATRKHYVAHQGGQHSGPLDNIMRDTFAEAYRVANTIILLPAGHKETVGDRLTRTSKSDAQPNRYGDSPRPDPASEFCPNDHR